jgi:hypothetical protein
MTFFARYFLPAIWHLWYQQLIRTCHLIDFYSTLHTIIKLMLFYFIFIQNILLSHSSDDKVFINARTHARTHSCKLSHFWHTINQTGMCTNIFVKISEVKLQEHPFDGTRYVPWTHGQTWCSKVWLFAFRKHLNVTYVYSLKSQNFRELLPPICSRILRLLFKSINIRMYRNLLLQVLYVCACVCAQLDISH